MVSMHRVSSTGNAANGVRPRKERRLTYVLSDSNDSKHCSGINCLRVAQSTDSGGEHNVLFSGSRDGTLKRWDITDEAATCSTTFESHTDWVNDAVVVGESLVSCSSDTTIKTWQAFSDGRCTKTFRQHSDYVIALAAGKHTNTVASAGLGGEVFIWDLEAANVPVVKAERENSDERSEGGAVSRVSSCNEQTMSPNITATQAYTPFAVKGHKESVYALSMNDAGTVLVSGGTEKAVRVWDPRTGTKKMKLKGHSDNIRALLLDASGRFCLSGSSDSMIRLWDLGQQRCVHSYAVHTDSIWALASTSSFSHVYSGGRDLSVYFTDLVSRESLLVCSEHSPILCLALENDDWLWSATSDSSIHRWPTKQNSKVKGLQKGSSFVAGTLPFARAKACLENSPAVPLNKEPTCVIPGTPGIIRHSVLNNRRHVLTKDAAGVVKLWEITRGAVIEDFGNSSFEEKEKELFEMISVPSWFTMDTRLGCISVHLDTPQCFSAEIYAVDLQVPGASEELKMNLGQETLKGLFAHWLDCKKERSVISTLPSPAVNGDSVTNDSGHVNGSQVATENQKTTVSHAFEFSSSCPPSIITEGSQGGPWRKKISDLDGSEDEKEIPTWCLECILYGRFSTKENMKCSFYLHPYEGTTVQVLTQGKLSAPRILRIHKVTNYVIEKMVHDKLPDENGAENHDNGGSSQNNGSQLQTSNGGSSGHRMRPWQQKTKPKVEILCNNQVLPPEMSLATVRQYVWKKPDDLALYFRVTN